tara:strand:+ start:203 stop:475 length:273 start_codon:yes stop_codon:yes gene_type:complete
MQQVATPKREKLLSTQDVCEFYGVSDDTLWRKRKAGYFVEGYHYIRIGTLKRSTFRWYPERIDEVFSYWKKPTKEILEIAKRVQVQESAK